MAYKFTSDGFDAVITKVTCGAYINSETFRSDFYCWPNEPVYPIDLSPLVNEFATSEDNSRYIPLLGTNFGQSYGLDLYRVSGMDGINIEVNWANNYNGSVTIERMLYREPLAAASTPHNIYIIWGYDRGGDGTSRVKVIYNDRMWIATSIGTDEADPQERTCLLGTPHSPVPLTAFPVDSTDFSGGNTSNVFDPDYYNNAAQYGFMCDLASVELDTALISLPITALLNVDGSDPEPYTPPEPEPPTPPIPDDPPFDPSQPDPYPVNPTHDNTSDEIPIPNMPVIGVSNAGFINVYQTAIGALQGLGDILFPQFSPPSDIVNAVEQLYNVIANQNLINYVIDCHVIPAQPAIGSNKNIKIGYRDTGISAPAVTYDYTDVHCGALNLAEYFHGYADYAATKSKLYLPFIGFVDMKPEFWQAGTITVDYKFNVIDGSFMCYVKSSSSKSQLANTVIAQYGGNACMHIPITGLNYAQMVSGVVGAGLAIASKGTASAVAGGAWSAANSIARGGDMQQSNAYNSTAALMGVRKPYLMIERAVPAFPSKYGHDKGYPSNITTQLSNVHGYTEIEDIDLTGLPFTADEIEELRSLLKDGVYF